MIYCIKTVNIRWLRALPHRFTSYSDSSANFGTVISSYSLNTSHLAFALPNTLIDINNYKLLPTIPKINKYLRPDELNLANLLPDAKIADRSKGVLRLDKLFSTVNASFMGKTPWSWPKFESYFILAIADSGSEG